MTHPAHSSRRRLTLAVAALSCALPMCQNTLLATPDVSVEVWHATGACFQVSPDNQSDPLSTSGESAPDTCPTTSVVDSLAGGADVIRLVIDYGSVQFSASETPPMPTVTLMLDGVSVPANATVTQLAQANLPSSSGASAIFLATFTAPARNVDAMWINVSAGQGFSHSPIGPFVVQAPLVAVSFPQCASGNICGSDGVVAVQVTAPAALGPTATLQWAFNGVPQPVSSVTTLTLNEADLTTGSISTTGGAYDPPVTMVTGIALLPLPLVNSLLPTSGTNELADGGAIIGNPVTQGWAVLAQVGASVGASEYPGTIPAAVTVTLPECSSGLCTVSAGVGLTLVTITALQGAGSSATLLWSYLEPGDATDGGAPGPVLTTGTAVSLASLGTGTQLETATVAVPVPSGPIGDGWTLTAVVGGYSAISQPIVLTPPAITLTFDACPAAPASCLLQSGAGSTPVTIVAPGAPGLTATLTWSLDGVPQQTTTPVLDGGSLIDAGASLPAGSDAGTPISVTLSSEVGQAPDESNLVGATVLLPIPEATAGTVWTVEVQIGAYATATSATLTAAAAPTPTITPANPATVFGGVIVFSAAAGSGAPYTWTCQGSSGSACINPAGVYTAGSAVGSDVITVSDFTGNTTTTTVSVYPPVTITPPGALAVGVSIALQASGGSDGPYVWAYATNGNKSFGILTPSGVYTPGPVAATDVVQVHDTAGDTKAIALMVP